MQGIIPRMANIMICFYLKTVKDICYIQCKQLLIQKYLYFLVT